MVVEEIFYKAQRCCVPTPPNTCLTPPNTSLTVSNTSRQVSNKKKDLIVFFFLFSCNQFSLR